MKVNVINRIARLLSLALMTLASGCATSHQPMAGGKTEGHSAGNVQVMPPTLYQHDPATEVVGLLQAKGIGAHERLAHLHIQIINESGSPVEEVITPAPAIKHDPFSQREKAIYRAKLSSKPANTDSVKVRLHYGAASDCKSKGS